MKALTSFLPVFTTGMTVEAFYSQIKSVASEVRNTVSSATQTKIDTFLQKFSIGDCQAVTETIEKFTGGLVKFTKEQPKRTFTIRAVQTTQDQIQASSPEEAQRLARERFPNAQVSVV